MAQNSGKYDSYFHLVEKRVEMMASVAWLGRLARLEIVASGSVDGRTASAVGINGCGC